MKKASGHLLPLRHIESQIYLLRREKVMLGPQLALLYGVETKILNQAVKRNIDRFPSDFMFKITKSEFSNLRSQIVTSSWGGHRWALYAFTEQGVAMLSSVLHSPQAVHVNIEIMRAFVKLRKLLQTHALQRPPRVPAARDTGHERKTATLVSVETNPTPTRGGRCQEGPPRCPHGV